jgi:outer membrane autotransporter protein
MDYANGVNNAAAITIASDTTQLQVTTGKATQSGVISEDAAGRPLEKIGAGTLILSATNTYTGDTTVSAGTLAVTGSIDSDVTVASGATLGGTGDVGGVSILSGGIYAPGNNAIGMQTVNGPVSFAAGSFFDVEVDDAGNADNIEATGAATLAGGTVRVMAQAGSYSPLTDYTILTASSVSGTFDGVASDMAFLSPFLSYDATNVYLRLIRNDIVLADVSETPNQRAVAGALDQFDLTDPLYLAVLVQSADGARQAYDALSGEVHATLPGILLNDSRYVRDAILSRLQQASHAGGAASSAVALLGTGGPAVATLGGETMMGLGMGSGGAAPPPAYGAGLAFWAQGFGAWGDFDGDGNAASADRTLGGFVSGVDAALGGGWRAGLAAGYSQSDVGVDARLSSADVDSYHLAAYAGGRISELALRAGGAWTWHDIDTTRTVVFPNFLDRTEASYDADTGQIFAEAALPMGMGDTAIEPFAGIAYVHVNTGGFTESGGLSALTAAGSDEDVGYSTLGLRAAATMRIDGVQVTPRASIAWQHALGDVNPDLALAFNANGIGFGISGVPIARDSALVDAGVDLAIAPDATIGVSYLGQLASDVEDHGIKGRFDWRF